MTQGSTPAPPRSVEASALNPDRRLDVAAYLFTVGLALWSGWQAADLVWGVWATGVVGTLVVLVAPWLLLTYFPGLSPNGTTNSQPVEALKDHVSVLVMLAVFWGFLLVGYAMAGSMILGWIPLPGGAATEHVRWLPTALLLTVREYWVMVLVNLAYQGWPVWRAIRGAGTNHRRTPSCPWDSCSWSVP